VTSRFGSLTINAYDQTDAANKAIRWALGFYDEKDLRVVASEFRVSPTRFWLITLAEPKSDDSYFAVVLALRHRRISVVVAPAGPSI
jgi:hypothetical protein